MLFMQSEQTICGWFRVQQKERLEPELSVCMACAARSLLVQLLAPKI